MTNLSNYSEFTPNRKYYEGNRVIRESGGNVCLWECMLPTYQDLTLNPYTYSTNRAKIYNWKLVCCEKSTTPKPTFINFGSCIENLPRLVLNPAPLVTNKDLLDDYYENGIFL
jgi:hypothetical protein